MNGGVSESDVSEINDPRVVKIQGESSNSIGEIKKRAFNAGSGDVLVEVDHDDLLTQNCLAKLAEAYQDPEIGFVASNNAKLHHEDKFIPYDSSMGWHHKRFKYGEKELWAPMSFEPTSHSLSYIWFAPDHVRSWRTSVYHEVGGHNPDMEVLDDQELMIRTYLKTKFKLLEDVLYIYRIDGKNTWIDRSQKIQEGTIRLANQYSQKLAERDAQLHGKILVDIGGGLNPRKGYLTLDQAGADITCDLNERWPLDDNSVGVINASHVIEHLKDPIHTMREIHRVLHHGGWAFIEVPSTDGRGAFQDPTHVSFWNQNSFWYYTKKQQADFIRNTDIRFQCYRNETHYPNEWWRENNIPVVTAHLIAIKAMCPRYPGALEI
jgi:SAM-dependent methyltransferase